MPIQTPSVYKPRALEDTPEVVCELVLPYGEDLRTLPSVVVLTSSSEHQTPVAHDSEHSWWISKLYGLLEVEKQERISDEVHIVSVPIIPRTLCLLCRNCRRILIEYLRRNSLDLVVVWCPS